MRHSEKKVRPEVYETINKLKCSYYLSKAQAEAAVDEVGYKLFDRRWKYHTEAERVDLDTLLHSSNIKSSAKSMEVLVVAGTAIEILTNEETSSVTYSDDGSKMQGAGSFTVQGVTIDGKYRALPTLSTASESQKNLADLKVATLRILPAAAGVEAKLLFEKIDFLITDQSAHKFGVNNVFAELDSTNLPDHLFCNVHPILMFNRVLTKPWAKIEDKMG